MPSLFNYFKSDFKGFSVDRTINFEIGVESIEINEKVISDLEGSSRYFVYYIPNFKKTSVVIQHLVKNFKSFISEIDMFKTTAKYPTDIILGNESVIYSKKIYFYIETPISHHDLEILNQNATLENLNLIIRDNMYKENRDRLDKPMAFISHDSKDKDLIARPIAEGLSKRLCTIWYDEYSLKIGDSLRESIEKGIKETKKCVLILTPNFLSNPSWGKKEFSSIFTKEMVLQERIILPIWYNVTPSDIYEYSPSLADTLALTWPNKNDNVSEEYDRKVEILISKLHTAITT
ncbi:toll/interleukin-1 receptor domain-containing protein [uncultured Aquimarina sp.]|uniref:toll/interleukin-1 receptor domain-containing protein n=1 Tax=uncultured Aquimarina sp. TaxID=575652 RepID=UPI0026016501|nr:toll/interleukin-1 receptor domain-containing protein [uncultured Aquimarina sp.]